MFPNLLVDEKDLSNNSDIDMDKDKKRGTNVMQQQKASPISISEPPEAIAQSTVTDS